MKRSWLIAGAVVGCLAGAAVGACGNSSGTGGSGGGGASGSTTTSSSKSTGSGTGSTSSGSTSSAGATSSSTSGAGGAGGGCSTPSTLHPPSADAGTSTLYCPFSAVDGGKNLYCTNTTEHCCEPKMGTATCDPIATACAPMDMDWQCEDPKADCPSGQVCCAPGATFGQGAPGCANFAHTMTKTQCMAAASCTGMIMCTSNDECPASQPTCTPFKKAGNQVGACQ